MKGPNGLITAAPTAQPIHQVGTQQNGDPDCCGSNRARYSMCLTLPYNMKVVVFFPSAELPASSVSTVPCCPFDLRIAKNC